MRVFLDTNVLVAGFATRGLCAELVEIVIADHQLVLGSRTMTELRRVLRSKIGLPPASVSAIADFLAEQAEGLVRAHAPVDATVDPDDAWVLAEALAGNANVFVTGDRGILEMGKVGSMPVHSPRQFWQLLKDL